VSIIDDGVGGFVGDSLFILFAIYELSFFFGNEKITTLLYIPKFCTLLPEIQADLNFLFFCKPTWQASHLLENILEEAIKSISL